LFDKEHDPKTKPCDISYVWKCIKCMRLAHPDALEDMKVLDVAAYSKWNKVDNDDSKLVGWLVG
jgi:hypothetical protein